MKKLARILVAITAVLAVLWVVGPYEPAPLRPTLDVSVVGGDVDAYFAARESAYDDIIPGTQKRVIWAGQKNQKTPWAVVYIHGFSATSEEIRPVPDRVADDLGANLVFTRLRGHGRDSAAMAEATVQYWINDVAEALAAARAVGDKVLVISTSTGGTLVAAAAHDPQMFDHVEGVVFISPNFGINTVAAPLLTFPGAKYWLPLIVGTEHAFTPRNDMQAKFWTTKYPSVAVAPMAALVKKVTALDHQLVQTPAFFIFSDQDKVVDPAITERVVSEWGGPTSIWKPTLTPEDDSFAHVVAGDIVSPGQTQPTIDKILSWVKAL